MSDDVRRGFRRDRAPQNRNEVSIAYSACEAAFSFVVPGPEPGPAA